MIFRRQFSCLLLICFSGAATASPKPQNAVPTSENLIAQMLQAQAANRIHFVPYVVTRDYKLFQGASSATPKSHVVADITVVPPALKKYTIESSVGSGLAERIVRKALDGEVAFAKDTAGTDITGENYIFVLTGENRLNGELCYLLELIPKRKSKNLIRGTLWIDVDTHLPRRVEGQPARDPSWWITDVRIVLVYGYVGPMWVQVFSEATANLRIVGRASMVWQDVSYQLSGPRQSTSLTQINVVPGEDGAEDLP